MRVIIIISDYMCKKKKIMSVNLDSKHARTFLKIGPKFIQLTILHCKTLCWKQLMTFKKSTKI